MLTVQAQAVTEKTKCYQGIVLHCSNICLTYEPTLKDRTRKIANAITLRWIHLNDKEDKRIYFSEKYGKDCSLGGNILEMSLRMHNISEVIKLLMFKNEVSLQRLLNVNSFSYIIFFASLFHSHRFLAL